MRHIPSSSSITVNFTKKIKLFRIFGTFYKKEPTTLVRDQRTKEEKLVKAIGERK